ncbi:hypothetical protein ACM66B_005020 [Microbotryomycetes sp. NB124-2]
MPRPLPAWQTKQTLLLDYELPTGQLAVIEQACSGVQASTGTTVWLGSQILSAYVAETHKTAFASTKRSNGPSERRRKRALDVGSGTGLMAITLSSLGYDVVATDIACISDTLLATNLERFKQTLTTSNNNSSAPCQKLESRTLDWFAPPSSWKFDRQSISPPAEDDAASCAAVVNPAAQEAYLTPPFDLITTCDSVYDMSLVQPLVRTLTSLALSSAVVKPTIYVALENRDPLVTKAFFDLLHETHETDSPSEARSAQRLGGKDGSMTTRSLSWSASRIPDTTIDKIAASKLGWHDKSDYDGVEIWKLALKQSKPV